KPFRDDRKNKFDGDRKSFSTRGNKPETRPSRFNRENPKPETDLIRLNKYISNSGVCSRREADDMIVAGIISVNDEIITRLGTKISPTDIVKYNNETLRRERNVYVLLNKPKDYITTSDDPEKRNTVMELVADACKERIYPVGRLDRNTTGVLLFTNDGELTKKLTHPSSNIKKIYHVELDRNVKSTDLDKIAAGIELEDGMMHVDAISYDDPVDKSHIGIELHSGKNRIVRRIFEALEYEVKKLDRVYFAGLTKKDLPRGRWRFLTDLEVGSLKMKSGKKIRVKTE
ncbi:MAG: pseudouridine synthase, partial [Bacteroidota bacterium]